MVKNSLTRRPNAGDKFVKLVLFQTAPGAEISPGVLTGRGIVDISAAVKKGYTPQVTMQGIIDEFERLRPALDKLAGEGNAVPLDRVRLRPPLPRPGKILACIANYWEPVSYTHLRAHETVID